MESILNPWDIKITRNRIGSFEYLRRASPINKWEYSTKVNSKRDMSCSLSQWIAYRIFGTSKQIGYFTGSINISYRLHCHQRKEVPISRRLTFIGVIRIMFSIPWLMSTKCEVFGKAWFRPDNQSIRWKPSACFPISWDLTL